MSKVFRSLVLTLSVLLLLTACAQREKDQDPVTPRDGQEAAQPEGNPQESDQTTPPDESEPESTGVFSSSKYGVTLDYPITWSSGAGDESDRFEGEDGFFQMGAVSGEGMTIDAVTEGEAYHPLNPYGSNPGIDYLEIDGQEARLIRPSENQPPEMNHQAGLIVKYPQPIKIGNEDYHYFILWADESHIRGIGQTLRFVKK